MLARGSWSTLAGALRREQMETAAETGAGRPKARQRSAQRRRTGRRRSHAPNASRLWPSPAHAELFPLRRCFMKTRYTGSTPDQGVLAGQKCQIKSLQCQCSQFRSSQPIPRARGSSPSLWTQHAGASPAPAPALTQRRARPRARAPPPAPPLAARASHAARPRRSTAATQTARRPSRPRSPAPP